MCQARVYASNYAYVSVRVYSAYIFTRVYLSDANCRSRLGHARVRVRSVACTCAEM